MEQQKITIETSIPADKKSVWHQYTKAEHIVNWNFASDDWQCPSAANDLRAGGKYAARMEAKNGSFGFDFEAVYDEVIEHERLAYTMSDGRQVTTLFSEENGSTRVITSFEAENQHDAEVQRAGWQAILDNFRKYVITSL